jgi:hypothetical protein
MNETDPHRPRRAGRLALGAILLVPAAAPGASRADRVTFTGMCEAAAASALDDRRLVVADRAGSVLRVYDVRGGPPLAVLDLAPWLDDRESPPEESHIRGGARLGQQTFWLTSHARGRDGRRDPARSRFFATAASAGGDRLEPVGRPDVNLRKELLKLPELSALGKPTRIRGPDQPGGLDLAALAEGPDGRSLLIGFRNPLLKGRALVVSLLNPGETIAGQPPRFGVLQRIDLQGLGVAELFRWRGRYVVVGAPVGAEGGQRLFLWDGASDRPEPAPVDLAGLHPAAAVAVGGRDRHVLILGGGLPCRPTGEGALDQLHAVWVRLP